jgi:hypothetical protein
MAIRSPELPPQGPQGPQRPDLKVVTAEPEEQVTTQPEAKTGTLVEFPTHTKRALADKPVVPGFRKRVAGVIAATAIGIGLLAVGADLASHGGANPDTTPSNPPATDTLRASNLPSPEITPIILNPLTQQDSFIQIGPTGVPVTETNPHGSDLLLHNLTVVNTEESPDGKTTWLYLATSGNTLTKTDLGTSLPNYDGSKTEQYSYMGVGIVKVGINDGVLSGESGFEQGRTPALRKMIEKGDAVTITVNLDISFNKDQETMNRQGFIDLNNSVGKPTILDTNKPTATFFAYHVYSPSSG